MTHADPFRAVEPWPLPNKSDCIFYHSLDLPDGETIDGVWDIRAGFDEYIGKYPLAGKTVLDVGTASGFLAFNAERAGATVTAVDARDARDIRLLQFHNAPFHFDRSSWFVSYDDILRKLKNSFWYAWHKRGSQIEVAYVPIEEYPFWGRRFDVVMAGAIIEHLSDPVTAIGNLASLTNEALIIPFTPIEDTDEQIMRTANEWGSREFCYTWWTLSRGLYKRLFDNLGFSVEFKEATALARVNDETILVARPTIVATRLERANAAPRA